jgi:hypothetical protein
MQSENNQQDDHQPHQQLNGCSLYPGVSSEFEMHP